MTHRTTLLGGWTSGVRSKLKLIAKDNRNIVRNMLLFEIFNILKALKIRTIIMYSPTYLVLSLHGMGTSLIY